MMNKSQSREPFASPEENPFAPPQDASRAVLAPAERRKFPNLSTHELQRWEAIGMTVGLLILFWVFAPELLAVVFVVLLIDGTHTFDAWDFALAMFLLPHVYIATAIYRWKPWARAAGMRLCVVDLGASVFYVVIMECRLGSSILRSVYPFLAFFMPAVVLVGLYGLRRAGPLFDPNRLDIDELNEELCHRRRNHVP